MRKNLITNALFVVLAANSAEAKDRKPSKADEKFEAALHDEWIDRCPSTPQVFQYAADNVLICQTDQEKEYFTRYYLLNNETAPERILPKRVSKIPSNLDLVGVDSAAAWVTTSGLVDEVKMYLEHDALSTPECYLSNTSTDTLGRTSVIISGPLEYCQNDECKKTYGKLEFLMLPPYCESFEAFTKYAETQIQR